MISRALAKRRNHEMLVSSLPTPTPSVSRPPGFVDAFPERGDWTISTKHPFEWEKVETLMSTGKTSEAVWTGRLWWDGAEHHLIGWRRIPDSPRPQDLING
jgi:hypothetical protein